MFEEIFSDRKSKIVLTIGLLLLGSVTANQWLDRRGVTPVDSGDKRAVASLQPENYARSVLFEHELAKKMALDNQITNSSLASRPTLRDEFLFGKLKGMYSFKLNEGYISSLKFSSIQGQPIKFDDSFILNSGKIWSKDFTDLKKLSSEGNSVVFELFDSKNQSVGYLKIQKDDSGNLLNITIE